MNRMPGKPTGERRGPGSHAFDGAPSAGAPVCYTGAPSELGGLSAGASENLNAKGGGEFDATKEQSAALAEFAGVKVSRSSSVKSEGPVSGIAKPGDIDFGGRTPRVQKPAPHSD